MRIRKSLSVNLACFLVETPCGKFSGNFAELLRTHKIKANIFMDMLHWPRGSTGVQRYGCIPRSAANNLGELPQKLRAPNPLFSRLLLGREHFGTRPCQSPSRFGIRLHFLRPHFPSPNCNSMKFFRANFVLQMRHPWVTNPGTTPITILAVNSDHGLSFAGEGTRTMV